MSHFKHNDTGTVIIDDYHMPEAEFLMEEPGYVKPAGCIAREYFIGHKDLAYSPDYQISTETGEESILDGYIAKLATYKANIQARLDASIDSDYAPDLAEAKRIRKQASKREAVNQYNLYRDSDLELTQTELDDYRADLVAQKATIGTEIDALTTIKEVREYEYTNWPPMP